MAILARGAAAASPPPLTIPDLVGTRTLALEGGVGLANQTEALFLNPAALAARKRFVVDSFYLTDRRPGLPGDASRQDYFGGAVADSSTTPLAAGFGYTRAMHGVETGTLFRLGLAAPLSQGLYAGVQGNYFNLGGAAEISSEFNMDAGLFFQISPKVSLGAAGYNLLGSSHREFLPRGYAFGFAAGSETSLQVIGDWRIDLDRLKSASGGYKAANRYSVGAEYLFANAVPVRAGFQIDDISRTKWWSVGAGYVTSRVSAEAAWRQSTTDPKARTVSLTFRVFVPNE
jgi:hypothetical protein